MTEIKENKNLCSACLLRLNIEDINSSNDNTLWGFNPYSYSTYRELKLALDDYIKKNYLDENSHFYNLLNEDGYTFSQWNIYYLSKNDTKSKRLHLQTMWLFYLLSEYPFFSEMIRCGKRDDPLHHTLHHFLTYVEKYGSTQKKIVCLLTQKGNVSMDDMDSEGNTPATLLLEKAMNKDDIQKCNELTRSYKELEKICLHPLYENYHIRLCDQCSEPVGLFEDITTHFEKIRHLSKEIQKMTALRDECNSIYKKYGEDSASIKRHQYVVDLYTSLLNL